MNLSITPTLLLLVLVCGSASSQQGPVLSAQALSRSHSGLPMESILHELGRTARAGRSLERICTDYELTIDPEGLVEVDVVGPVGGDSIPASIVAACGGWVRLTWRHRASVRVAPRRLLELARSLPPGFHVQTSGNAQPLDVTGAGPATIGSDSYRDAGADGTGIRVAVLDNGFQYYSQAQANGDVPPFSDATILDGDANLSDGGQHGTACTEQVFDHAPGAEIFLVKMNSNSPTQLGAAIDWCIDRDVDIITASISYFNGGWEDGSGDACAALEEATDNGILVFMAAGNFAEIHWRGGFVDTDGDNWHEFAAGATPALSDETNQLTLAPGKTLQVYLQWDQPQGGANYDIYLYDKDLEEVLEDTAGNPPNLFDYLAYKNKGAANVLVKVLVRRVSGAATDIQLIQRRGVPQSVEYQIPAGSLTSSAASDDPNVIAVGAALPGATLVTNYSSRGPTNSGNIKPDLVGPTSLQCFAYGYPDSPSGVFGGTSCATPNVAGAAAALWSSLPEYSSSGIRMLLLRQALLIGDWGPAGLDDDHGHGGADLYPYHPGTVWTDRTVSNPLCLSSLPFESVSHAYPNVDDGGRILFLGGAYPDALIMLKNILLETVVQTAVIGD